MFFGSPCFLTFKTFLGLPCVMIRGRLGIVVLDRVTDYKHQTRLIGALTNLKMILI